MREIAVIGVTKMKIIFSTEISPGKTHGEPEQHCGSGQDGE
jgi:hypothetical protein